MYVFPQENNPFWPLPADYETLSEEGRRLARVNAASLNGTPELAVAGAKFFRDYYLIPTPVGQWYKHGVVESPPAHYRFFAEAATQRRLLFVAPRSFAKSTLVREKILRDLCTKSHWETLLVLVRMEKVYDDFGVLMTQIESNPRIIEDFGSLKPERGGGGSWNKGYMKLKNGSAVKGAAIKSVVGGPRPHAIVLDDVERDDSMQLNPSDMKECFGSMLWNALTPMAEEGVPILVIGSYPRPNSFIDWMATTDDPRIVRNWRRVILSVDDDGKGGLLWEKKFDKNRIKSLIEELGEEVFDLQYRSKPGLTVKKVFTIDPQLDTYWLEGPDPAESEQPLLAKDTKIIAYRPGKSTPEGKVVNHRVELPFADAVNKMYRFITVDYANTSKMSSDNTAIHVLGYSRFREFPGVLWSLDMDSGKFRRPEIVRRIVDMAQKWGVSHVGIEAYPIQLDIYQELMEGIYSESENRGWRVKPRGIKFPTSYEKADKIRGIEKRFRDHLIKLPVHRSKSHPYYNLFYQVMYFTDDMNLLRTDDEIDTLAMSMQMVQRPTGTGYSREGREITDVQKMRAGNWIDPQTGFSLMTKYNINELPDEVITALLFKSRERAEREAQTEWQRCGEV